MGWSPNAVPTRTSSAAYFEFPSPLKREDLNMSVVANTLPRVSPCVAPSRGLLAAAALGCSLALFATTTTHAQAQPRYMLTVIDTPGRGLVSALDQNEHGQLVAGDPLVWESGLYHPLALPKGFEVFNTSDINDHGDILGSVLQESFVAAIWSDGEVIVLGGTKGEDFTFGLAMNNNREVIGQTLLRDGTYEIFRWQDGVRTDIPGFKGGDPGPHAINDAGQIVGSSSLPLKNGEFDQHAALWTADNEIIDLGTLGAGPSFARAITEDGTTIVGEADTDTSSEYWPQAVRWVNGKIEQLSSTGWSITRTSDINASGIITGSGYLPSESFERALLWLDDTVFDLNEITLDRRGYRLVRAGHINDAGQITVEIWGNDLAGPGVLTPIHMDISEPVPGQAGMVNMMQVTGATPGRSVALIYGHGRGATSLPGCTSVLAGIAAPTFAGSAVADADGIAQFRRFVGKEAQGRVLFIQAVNLEDCTISQVRKVRFE